MSFLEHFLDREQQKPEVLAVRQAAKTRIFEVQEVDLRFANGAVMTIEAYDIPGVQVFQDGSDYYLKYDAPDPEPKPEEGGGLPVKKADGTTIKLMKLSVRGKLEGGKLMLRVSFNPGKMPLPVVERFKSE